MISVYVVGGSIKLYKKGSDLKIKGIDNLNGLPDMTIFKTDRIESIVAECVHGTAYVHSFPTKPTGFSKINVQNLDQ